MWCGTVKSDRHHHCGAASSFGAEVTLLPWSWSSKLLGDFDNCLPTTQCHFQFLSVYFSQQNVHICIRQYSGSVAHHRTDTVNCMIVYLSVRACVCAHVYMCVRTCVHVCARMCACVRAYVCMCLRTCVHVCGGGGTVFFIWNCNNLPSKMGRKRNWIYVSVDQSDNIC